VDAGAQVPYGQKVSRLTFFLTHAPAPIPDGMVRTPRHSAALRSPPARASVPLFDSHSGATVGGSTCSLKGHRMSLGMAESVPGARWAEHRTQHRACTPQCAAARTRTAPSHPSLQVPCVAGARGWRCFHCRGSSPTRCWLFTPELPQHSSGQCVLLGGGRWRACTPRCTRTRHGVSSARCEKSDISQF
jgi:hypothetical protein